MVDALEKAYSYIVWSNDDDKVLDCVKFIYENNNGNNYKDLAFEEEAVVLRNEEIGVFYLICLREEVDNVFVMDV